MYKIPLTQGKVALVNRRDFHQLRKLKWRTQHIGKRYYAVRSDRRRIIWMHRVILGLTYGDKLQGDHRDGNGLNNQRSNLRIANHSQNQQHKNRYCNNTSGFKGVYKAGRRWFARIYVANKRCHLGHFDSPIDAARAYNRAAKKLHGCFAKLNKIRKAA